MAFDNFIPEIWSARLLDHLDNVHVYASLMNRDYEGEIRAYGDTVHINQLGNITIQDYDGSDIADPEELDGEQQNLVIDQAKYFNFQVKDIDNAQSNPKLIDAAMQRASYGINDVVDQYLANLLLDGCAEDNILYTDDTAVTPTATNAYDYLVDMGTALSEANVPMMGRWVVVPPWFHALLLKDERFVGNGTGYNQAILQGGLVGEAAGFQIHLSNNVPNTDGANYKIIAGTNVAGSFAEQLVELEAYRLEKNFSDAVKGLHAYGAKVVQPSALAVMTVNK
ncbi:MAG: P22 coat protein - protein 5 domain protein [Clostridiales bacterium]|nr:P22 coat protein - protein 5 domain protein [Clostridiales bacterium]